MATMVLNQLRRMRTLLYRLKRTWGQSVVFSNDSIIEQDTSDGSITRTTATCSIRRVILCKPMMEKKFWYDLSYLAAANNFTYGGFMQVDQVTVLVSRSDLSSGFEIGQHTYMTFDGRRYNVEKLSDFEEGDAVLGVLKGVNT